MDKRKKTDDLGIPSESNNSFKKQEREKLEDALIAVNKELDHQNDENKKQADELTIANEELSFQNEEKDKRAAELLIANEELVFQQKEKKERADELTIANEELSFQNEEKDKRAAELLIANKELIFQQKEKKERADELIIADKELVFQKKEKKKRAAELTIADRELSFQKQEKKKRAAELTLANKELTFQKQEKKKRAAELVLANKELAFQEKEKKKRAAELILANKELAFQEKEKKKRATELIIANKKLLLENKEKEKRTIELSGAKLKLEKKEQQCKFVLDSSPNAMVLINKKGLISFINKQTEILFGYEKKELEGNKLELCIPEISSLNNGDNIQALKKDGSKLLVEVSLIPIEMTQGHMILACINDITNQKKQEATEQKQTEQETKNKEAEQFAYTTSHDLQEPLRTVSNYVYLLERGYLHVLDENALNYIRSINDATKRMSTLIKSILNFSRLGQLSKKKTFVDCRKVIDEVLSDLSALIKASDSVIEITEMPELNVHETEFRQLFQNLITNAIKFCKKGNSPIIKICSEKLNDKWKFSVCDNGIGIAPIYFSRVFDIFQRLNHEYEGHGIGLANCKKIVQLHHGEIWLESVLGEGTKFHFTIPN